MNIIFYIQFVHQSSEQPDETCIELYLSVSGGLSLHWLPASLSNLSSLWMVLSMAAAALTGPSVCSRTVPGPADGFCSVSGPALGEGGGEFVVLPAGL